MARGIFTDTLPAATANAALAGAPPAAPPPGAPPAAPPAPGGALINQNTPSVDQYGRFTSGPYQGLTQEQAAQKVSAALETHGGYSLQPGEYRVNYTDGSITILKTPANGNDPLLTPGTKVDQTGNIFMPDGSPAIDPTTGKPAQTMFGVNGEKSQAMLTSEQNTPALTNLLEGNPGDAASKALGGLGSLVTGLGGSLAGPSLGGLNKASSDAQALEQQFLGQLQGLQPGVAPQMTAAQSQAAGMTGVGMGATAMNAVGAQAAQAANAPQMTAAQAMAMAAQAAQAGNAPQMTAAQAQAAQAQAAKDVTASQMQAAGAIPAAQMTAAQLDDARQAQFRQQQSDLASNLSGVIAGNAPSVAELQERQAFAQQMAQQQGLAAAMGRGGNQALAMRTAMNNVGQLGAQQAAASALLRAQEQTAARGQLGGVLEAARGTDVTVAGQNAANQQGAAQVNVGSTNATNQFNAQNQQSASAANAQMQQQAALANAQNQQAALAQTSQQQQAANLANAQNQQQAGLTNVNNAQAVNLANAANQQTALSQTAQQAQQTALANAANQQQAGLTNVNNAQAVNLANAANQQAALSQTSAQAQAAASQNAAQAQAAAALTAQNQQQAGVVNATNQQQTALANAANQQAANANNQTSALTTTGQDISKQQVVGNQTLQANQNDVNAQVGAIQAQTQKTQQTMNLLSTGLGALSTLSDRRAKEDIKSISDADMTAFYRAIQPQSWKYKGDTQPRVGPMAQDVEKSRVGKTMIRETPAGKAIDIPSATTAMLAAIADLGHRVDKMEKRR